MAEESAKLRIPYIAAAQAQKHVTHNEAMTLLDTLVQLSVIDKDLATPPGSPSEGDTYIVAASATGAWIGWDKRVVRYIDGMWRSYLPGEGDAAGWLAWVMDEDAMYRFDGANWALAGIEGPEGDPGADGADAGVLFSWDTNIADSDPGAGDIKANNAALGSATKLFVSKTSRGGSTVAAFLLSLDNSTTSSRRGILVLTRTTDEAQATFDVATVTDATNYVKVDVSNHAGATSFSAANPISFQFWPTGDAGGAGGFNDLEGEWEAGTSYDELDVVSFEGSSYTSIAGGNIGNQPGTSPGDWQLLAQRGDTGAAGADGVDGTDGTDGADGTDPGILLTWDDNNADSDPGAGDLKADNETLSAATKLYVSKTSRGGSNIAAFLLALDDSTNPSRKGGLILTRTSDEAQAAFDVDVVTDATGYVKLDVSGHAGVTGFTLGDPISFQFSRDGDKGADGAGGVDSVNGQTGVVVLDAGDIGVTPAGGLSSTDVQAALQELDSEKAASSHGHSSGDVSDFTEAAQDAVGGILDDGGDIDFTYNDGTPSITGAVKNDAIIYAKMQNVSATDKLLGRSTAGAGDVEEIACTAAGRALIDDANAAAQRATLGLDQDSIEFVIDGGGSTITTGVKGDLEIPFACTINRVTLLADQSGSIVVNVWKDSYANFPPTVADKITASAPPTVSSAVKSQDSTLTGWTTSVSAGDILRFNVDSVTSIQRVTISLRVTK